MKWDSKIRVSEEAKGDLLWWLQNLESSNGKSFFKKELDLVIYADASLSRWGASCGGGRARGPWSAAESGCFINELELLAAGNAIKSFAAKSDSITIDLFLDNRSAVCYLNRGGGTKSSRLSRVAEKILTWCEKRNVALQVSYVPGRLNTIADEESRQQLDSSD